MFIREIKNNPEKYNLPIEFIAVLPDYCPTCGAVTEMSPSLTGLHCSNPRCPDKLMMRIRAICTSMNITDFGESTIEKFLDYYEVDSPLNIFGLELGMPIYEGASLELSMKIERQIDEKKHFLLWEYVQIANIPGVQTTARTIFQGYQSLEDAYEDIEAGGIQFIQDKLGVHSEDGEVSIRAMKVYSALMEYKDELFENINDVYITTITEDMVELNVVCSDQVGGGFKNKPAFYAYMKDKYKGRIHFNFLSSVNKQIDYLVWAGADGSPARYTSKVRTVEGYQAKGLDIPILTAIQLIEELDSRY